MKYWNIQKRRPTAQDVLTATYAAVLLTSDSITNPEAWADSGYQVRSEIEGVHRAAFSAKRARISDENRWSNHWKRFNYQKGLKRFAPQDRNESEGQRESESSTAQRHGPDPTDADSSFVADGHHSTEDRVPIGEIELFKKVY